MGNPSALIALYVILGVLVLFLAIIIDFIVAKKFKKVASDKGHDADQLHVFAMCFWLTFIGYLYVIALPNKKE